MEKISQWFENRADQKRDGQNRDDQNRDDQKCFSSDRQGNETH